MNTASSSTTKDQINAIVIGGTGATVQKLIKVNYLIMIVMEKLLPLVGNSY